MKEQLYTIPVNDIFDKPCECPVCAMKLKLENDAVAFAMGPSYMEDDIRLTTDKIGFCTRHMQMMYDFENQAWTCSHHGYSHEEYDKRD